jgi:hypothetical protein
VYFTIDIEKHGKPSVVLVNRGFANDARAAASGKGMPGLRILPEDVPSECTEMSKIEAGVSKAMDDLVALLTRPLSNEEESPKSKVQELPRIVFEGTFEEVNRFFYKRGWSDGLPIVPPTEEAVKEMLTGTDLPAEQLVGKLIPRLGKATVEKIAINAVMAGALPTYMPVLIAALEALLDPRANLGGFGVSTGSWSPFWIINGPIRKDLKVESGSGALSPGNIANASIGRAMGLIMKNIGGARKGIEDMGVLGNPCKYSMVIAENEEESPWEPLHVEHGLPKEDSAVTVFFPNSYVQTEPLGTDAKGIMEGLIYNFSPGRGGLTTLILPPQHANVLAEKGWTKKEIAANISDYARAPAHHNHFYRLITVGSGWPGEHQVPPDPNEQMRIILDPDWIRIIVAGGPGNLNGRAIGAPPRLGRTFVTKKVTLPANWDKLVKKYGDLGPSYLHY